MEDLAEQSQLYSLASDIRVLAADDNRTNRLVMGKMMKQIGGALDIVEDGKAALEAYKSHPYDLLLFDIAMPVMDGTTALSEIRSFEKAAGATPAAAIAVTANTLEEQIAEYFRIGFNDCLAKPVKREGLAQAIQKVLET